MEETADLLTTTIRAFRLEASESSRVADIMATAVNKSKLDVDKLRIAFSYMAPAAKEAGISLEEAATATMLLADSGLRASTIGTSFRQFLAHLIAPTEAAKGKMAALGMNMDKLNPQFNSLKSILIELNRTIPDAGAAFDIFQLRAAPAVITMMKAVAEGSDTYDEYLTKVYEVGVAQKMADIQMEGVINKVKNLGSRFTVLAVSVGQSGILGIFGAFIDVLRNVMDLFTYLTGGLGQYVIAMTLAGAATFGLVKLLGLLSGLGIAKLFVMWGTTGYSLVAMLGALKAGFAGLWWTISSNPLITVLVTLASLAVAVKMYTDNIAQLSNEYAAEAIEIRKTEEKLQSYQNRLNVLNKDSLEYQSTLKRLASEYEPLKKYIDEVTGAWIDEAAGLKALNEEVKNKHSEAIAKQIESVAAQKFAISWVTLSFNELTDGVIDTKKETEQLTLYIKGLVPELKRLGITAESSGEQLKTALTNMYPSLKPNQIRYIADDLLRVLKEVAEKEAEQKKKAAERELMYAQGTRARVPEVFRAMYKDLGGIRAADAADILRKYDEALEAEKKHLDDRLINNEEFEKRKFKLALEYIDKLATASKTPLDTEGDVEKAKTDALKRYVEAADATFKNEIADEKQAYKIKLEEAKGFPKKVKDITDEHLKKIVTLEAKAADQIATYWQFAWESRKKMTKENFDEILQSILDFRTSLAGAETGNIVIPGTYGPESAQRGSIPRKDSSEPLIPTKGMVASDEDIMSKYKREVDEAIAISGQWGKAWANEWENATEFERTELATQAVIFKRLAKDLGGTDAQIARGREMSADSAIKSYKKNLKERKKEEQDAQKSHERFQNVLATMGVAASDGSDKILKQEQLNLEKADQLLKDWIEEYTHNFNRIKNEGQFEFFPDITEASARAKKLEEVIAQTTARAEKTKDEIRQGTWVKEVKYGQTLYDAKADFDHKYLSFMKSNSEKLEAEYTDYADDLKTIDRMVYDAKVWNATHVEAQIEGIEEKAYAMREARYEKHEQQLEKIAQKSIDKQTKAIDRKIEAERDSLEVDAGLKNLEALQSGAGQEVLLGMHRDYVEQKYQIDKNATDRALTEIDRSTDYGKKQTAKYVNQEVQAYNEVIAANRAYYQELYKDSEYYYRNQAITDEQYFEQLEKLRKWGAISNREYTEKMISLNGTMGEQVNLGFSRAKAGMQSFGELVVDWSTQMPEQFASGFTSAFREFASGTKTAAQAWQDFAQSFLWWCAEMMIKWAAMKAMGMMMGGTTGGGSWDSALGATVSGSSAFFSHHKGGIVGLESSGVVHAMASIFNKAQRLHSGGIAGDERAIVAKKGEGVFTEGQMKALSPNGGNLNITNITDPRVIDAYMATPAGRKSILNIIGAEAFKVNRILRTA
jgi:TP901 family phage tail tape measure protein